MKHLLTALFLLTSRIIFAQGAEEAAIKQVITSAYLEGIHNQGSIEEIRKGFHPRFTMYRVTENDIKTLSIEEWISNIEKNRKEPPTAPPVKTEGKFIAIDVTGNAATVKLELYKENKKIFTDYMSLYKFNEGWRIVAKTFHRH